MSEKMISIRATTRVEVALEKYIAEVLAAPEYANLSSEFIAGEIYGGLVHFAQLATPDLLLDYVKANRDKAAQS